MRSRVILWFMVALWLVGAAAQAQGNCEETGLVIGTLGQVIQANPLREGPDPDAPLREVIPPGQVFNALEGPVCAQGVTWWRVDATVDGIPTIGWMAERDASIAYAEPLEGQLVDYRDAILTVSLVLPTGLASSVEIAWVSEQPPTATEPFRHIPAHWSLTLSSDYADTNYREREVQPQIRLYAVDTLQHGESATLSAARYAVNGLDALLTERADLSRFGVTHDFLPDFAPGQQANLLAFLSYWDFRSGSGVHFLTHYARTMASPTNDRLRYRYLGLTTDGRYFVVADLPVEAPALPGEFGGASAVDAPDQFADYTERVTGFFELLPPERYTPNLRLLDTLIASLFVLD